MQLFAGGNKPEELRQVPPLVCFPLQKVAFFNPPNTIQVNWWSFKNLYLFCQLILRMWVHEILTMSIHILCMATLFLRFQRFFVSGSFWRRRFKNQQVGNICVLNIYEYSKILIWNYRLIDKERKLLENELKDYQFIEGGVIRKLLENELKDHDFNEGGFPVFVIYISRYRKPVLIESWHWYLMVIMLMKD